MSALIIVCVLFCQAEDGIRDLVRSRGLGDVYKRQELSVLHHRAEYRHCGGAGCANAGAGGHREAATDAVSYTHLTLPTSDLV